MTIAGKPNDDLAPGTKNSILKQSGTEMNPYLVIIEKTATGFSAYSPDLPGCVATGRTRKGVEKEIHDAIEFHIEGLRLAGQRIPQPQSEASYCEVAA